MDIIRFSRRTFFTLYTALVLISYVFIGLMFVYLPKPFETTIHNLRSHEKDNTIDTYIKNINYRKSSTNGLETKMNVIQTTLNNAKKKRFLALDDGQFFGKIQEGIVKCDDEYTEIEVTGNWARLHDADILFHHMDVPIKPEYEKPHYSMVYVMESEPHSDGGENWNNADFRMWYNLDLSFPEPVTYFHIHGHLSDLLSPFHVEFENKTNNAPIVWLISRCDAYNAREVYVEKLMQYIQIDSYGNCLQNKFSHTRERMHGNVELYSKYKFVIAIENSNCVDYVTEKLIHAVASGSIPIVAGKDNKPDYLKFLPKNSFINIYDYKSAEDLARHINIIASNKTLYESYLPFKRHIYSKDYLKKLKLPELIELAKKIIGPNEKMFSEIVKKEKSEDKLCKIVRYLLSKDEKTIQNEIDENRRVRPEIHEVCLPEKNLMNDFQLIL